MTDVVGVWKHQPEADHPRRRAAVPGAANEVVVVLAVVDLEAGGRFGGGHDGVDRVLGVGALVQLFLQVEQRHLVRPRLTPEDLFELVDQRVGFTGLVLFGGIADRVDPCPRGGGPLAQTGDVAVVRREAVERGPSRAELVGGAVLVFQDLQHGDPVPFGDLVGQVGQGALGCVEVPGGPVGRELVDLLALLGVHDDRRDRDGDVVRSAGLEGQADELLGRGERVGHRQPEQRDQLIAGQAEVGEGPVADHEEHAVLDDRERPHIRLKAATEALQEHVQRPVDVAVVVGEQLDAVLGDPVDGAVAEPPDSRLPAGDEHRCPGRGGFAHQLERPALGGDDRVTGAAPGVGGADRAVAL
ncbi:hypothetical protein GCM10023321_73440 [Pseudonocardia eucalypti]|uniref:Uncharacterized protein n=1 Tax=Pseudonocardia eucalypti TaxID=648755 RepID=A0ABP9R894_9PSEU